MSGSGYAADILPGIVNADEAQGMALPRAEPNGRQHGRPRLDPVAAGQRPFKVVGQEEANKNLAARIKGDMPPIAAPVQTQTQTNNKPGKVRGKRQTKASTVQDEQALRRNEPMATTVNDTDNYDPLGGEYAPGDPVLEAEERALAATPVPTNERRALGAVNPVLTERVYQPQTLHPSYLDQRGRATLTLTDGTFSMPCIDVKECPIGITLLLPMDPNQSTFIPKPGVELSVSFKGKTWECYFPGVYFEVEELKLVGLMFVRKEA